jgi:hypothetical protein
MGTASAITPPVALSTRDRLTATPLEVGFARRDARGDSNPRPPGPTIKRSHIRRHHGTPGHLDDGCVKPRVRTVDDWLTEPRRNASKRGEPRSVWRPRKHPFAGQNPLRATNVGLLAMQKVVGSSPISRLKGPANRTFLVPERCPRDVDNRARPHDARSPAHLTPITPSVPAPVDVLGDDSGTQLRRNLGNVAIQPRLMTPSIG